jgi:predicted transcriptional regulator of viral defense system
MNFLQFKDRFSQFDVLSVKEIERVMPGFNKMNLVNWQKKNYIIKIRNGYYKFSGRPETEKELFIVANKIYQPSYISLETALSYYNLIPEGVFMVQSITTLKTQTFINTLSAFHYHNIKKSAFTGYVFELLSNKIFRIASPEKALLDLFYLKGMGDKLEEIDSLRLNVFTLKEIISLDKMQTLAELFESVKLMKSVSLLKKYCNDFD